MGVSTVDRAIRATMLLENNAKFNGESVFQTKDVSSILVSLVYIGDVNSSATSCVSLSNVDVKGNIFLC